MNLICTKVFECLDLVDFEGTAFSAESVDSGERNSTQVSFNDRALLQGSFAENDV